jgi:predicted RNase H-like HicB family nuclease
MRKDVPIYPALLSEEGAYVCVRFPDLPGCNSFGAGYADAIAKDALGGHLLSMEEDNDPIPAPTPINKLEPEKEELAVLIDVPMDVLRK